MFRKPTLVGVALAVAGIAAIAAPARAAVPADVPGAEPFAVACSAGLHALVTLPVPGAFVPGSIVGTDAVLVPYRFDYRWTDAHGDVLSHSEDRTAAGPVPHDAITCRFARTEYSDGTFFSFTVTAAVA
jgi:hypothetical protein